MRRKAMRREAMLETVWSAKAKLSPFLAEAQLRRAVPISRQVDYFEEAKGER